MHESFHMSQKRCFSCGEYYDESQMHTCGALGGKEDITKQGSEDSGPGIGGQD